MLSAERSTASKDWRSERRDQRRHRLLQAALELFSGQGFHLTSVDQVVSNAKTSKSAFYEHWETKEDCFRELLEVEGGALIHSVTTSAAAGGNHRERLRLGIETFVRDCFDRAPVARLLLVESVGLSPAIEETRHEIQGRFVSVVEEEVAHAVRHDAFYENAKPKVFALAMVGAVNEATSAALMQSASQPATLIAELSRIFAPN